MLYLQLPLIYPMEYHQIFHIFSRYLTYSQVVITKAYYSTGWTVRAVFLPPVKLRPRIRLSDLPSPKRLRAGRSSSSSGFHSLSPWGRCRYLIESQSFVKVLIRVNFIVSAFLRMLPSQVYAHSLIQKPFERRQVAAAITVVKVAYPSPNHFIEPLDDHLFG